VIPANEFPSNRIVWEALKSKGVEVRQVEIYPSQNPEERLIQATDRNTRILSVSSVHYSNGLRLNLPQLGQFCHKKNILFCIDAIQSIGAIKTDVQECNADFVIADGHKWMLGPEGLALFYSTQSARDKLSLNEYGWHMVQEPHQFSKTDWKIAKSARRFECGSPNMLCAHALYESVNLILEYGIDHIEKKVLENTCVMHDFIQSSKNLTCISAKGEGRYAGIVTFQHNSIPSEKLYTYLMENNVMCADRSSAIRFSPHFYTDQLLIQKALILADEANTHI
jgi:selenocysteine lyase/cysteine desulfurase